MVRQPELRPKFQNANAVQTISATVMVRSGAPVRSPRASPSSPPLPVPIQDMITPAIG